MSNQRFRTFRVFYTFLSFLVHFFGAGEHVLIVFFLQLLIMREVAISLSLSLSLKVLSSWVVEDRVRRVKQDSVDRLNLGEMQAVPFVIRSKLLWAWLAN